jgi:hypothetical protein
VCENVPVNATTSDNIEWSCDPGYYKSGNICSACTGQTYKSDAGNGGCENVPVNATTSDNIEWSCDPGYYKSGNSCIECGGCPLNEYRSGCTPTSAGSCNTCPYGKYKNDTTNGGISSCIPCGMGRIAKNYFQAIYCVCPDGYAYAYRPGWGQWCGIKRCGRCRPEWAPGPSD